VRRGRPGARQSRSGYWKGAMKAPLAPSMWIMISQPCSLLSFSASKAPVIRQQLINHSCVIMLQPSSLVQAGPGAAAPNDTARCTRARVGRRVASPTLQPRVSPPQPDPKPRARTDGRVDALHVLKVARVGRAQDAHHADRVLVAGLSDLRSAGGASGRLGPQQSGICAQSASLQHVHAQLDKRHAAQAQGGHIKVEPRCVMGALGCGQRAWWAYAPGLRMGMRAEHTLPQACEPAAARSRARRRRRARAFSGGATKQSSVRLT